MPPVYLLIKPSSGMCNLRCRYCFYHDVTQNRQEASYGFMSEETMEQVVKKALDAAEGSCTIAFQGGEPTLIGLPFYRKVMEMQKKYNQKKISVYNAIQTNGYGLSREWAEFFHENHFLVGISVDGTIHTHNCYRKNAAGKDTFLDVMKTVDLFDQCQVEYNILTVVHKKTADALDKIYRYYRKMGFEYQQYIPCLDPLGKPSGESEYSLSPKAYGEFLCRLFDLWYDDYTKGRIVHIRQFENYLSILLTGRAESCDMNGFCSIQNVVEANGDVYPCDFFVLDEYRLGNLNTDTLEEIRTCETARRFIERSLKKPERCQTCPYLSLCRGGCYRHRIMAEIPGGTDYFCESYQIFFAHCLDRLIRIAKSF